MSFGITASSAIGATSGDSAFATAIMSESPLIYLPFNETSGTTIADASGNGRDATASGTVVPNQYMITSASGGRSTRVDGAGAITIAHSAWMDVAELTVIFNCFTTPAGIQMLASRYMSDSNSTLNSWFVDVGSGGTFLLYGRTSGGGDIVVDSGIVVQTAKRYMIAAYIGASGSGIRVYDDGGNLLGSNTGAGGTIQTSTADLMLFRSGAGYDAVGYMDDFVLLDRVLTTTRLDQLAALALGTSDSWLVMTEGTGARNGTTDHTLTFPAAAAGSLLVAVIGGAVTHTAVTAGWTKQVSATGSSEAAVFTITATGGETSFQVTHNASNYPIEWVVYEFAAGSTYYSGVGVSSGTLPTLSSLPGTKITTMMVGSDNLAFGNSALTTNWNYFWRTSINRNTLSDGVTDGVWLNVGRFAYNDFPDSTVDPNAPTQQYDVYHGQEKVLFAIQHA